MFRAQDLMPPPSPESRRRRCLAQWMRLFAHLDASPEAMGFGYQSQGQWILPDLRLPKHKMWVSVVLIDQEHHPRHTVESCAPFVKESQERLLIMYDSPALKAPDHQGWLLSPDKGDVKAQPIHLSECPHCQGFGLSSFGFPEQRDQHAAVYREAMRRVSTDTMLNAYRATWKPVLLEEQTSTLLQKAA